MFQISPPSSIEIISTSLTKKLPTSAHPHHHLMCIMVRRDPKLTLERLKHSTVSSTSPPNYKEIDPVINLRLANVPVNRKDSLDLTIPFGLHPVTIIMLVVSADIPAPLGLDTPDTNNLMIDNIFNRLPCRSKHFNTNSGKTYYVEHWYVPLITRDSGHLFAQLYPTSSFIICFTRPEILRLHRKFFHPSAGKLFALLQSPRPFYVARILMGISKWCDMFQRTKNASHRFRGFFFGSVFTSFNERLFFGHCVSI